MVGFALHQMFASVSEDTMERLVRKVTFASVSKLIQFRIYLMHIFIITYWDNKLIKGLKLKND